MPVHMKKLQGTQDGVNVGSTLDNQRQGGPTSASGIPPGAGTFFDLLPSHPSFDALASLGIVPGATIQAFGDQQHEEANNVLTGQCIEKSLAGIYAAADLPLPAPVCPDELTTGGGGSISTPVVPPVIEILAERRARRGQNATNLLAAAQQTVSPGAKVFPGFEGGGLADVLLGLITGKGVDAASGIIPDAARQVHRQTLPHEPSIESELPASLAAAQQILDAVRVV